MPFDKLLDVFWHFSQLKVAATAQFVGNISCHIRNHPSAVLNPLTRMG